MSSSVVPLSPEEIAARGDKLYHETIESQVSSAKGQVVAIDVHSGDFSLGEGAIDAVDDLKTRQPNAEVWLVRIGSRHYHRIGRGPRRPQ